MFYISGALTISGLGIDDALERKPDVYPDAEPEAKGGMKVQQTKKLPKGYHVESLYGTVERLVHDESGSVIASVNMYECQKLFRSENFIMSLYESPHWKALEAFYSNLFFEMRKRKQGGNESMEVKRSPMSIYNSCMEHAKETDSDYKLGLYDGEVIALHELRMLSDSQYEAYGRLRGWRECS